MGLFIFLTRLVSVDPLHPGPVPCPEFASPLELRAPGGEQFLSHPLGSSCRVSMAAGALVLRGVPDHSQSQNLFYVMSPVHPVKFPPLSYREWSQNGVVEDSGSRSVTGFALGDQFIHDGNSGSDFGQHLVGRHAFRFGTLWRFSPSGKVIQFRDQRDSDPLHGRDGSGQWLSRLQTALEAPNGPAVGSVKMLEHLRRTPLPFRKTLRTIRQLLGGHAASSGRNRLLQAFEIR